MTHARARMSFIVVAVSLSACGDRSVVSGDGGAVNDSTAHDSTAPSGCQTNVQCGKGTYCHLDSGCPSLAVPGSCKPYPTTCNMIYAPVCGCDGKQYGNPCVARMRGTNVIHGGTCGDCTAIQSAYAAASKRARRCGACSKKVKAAAGSCCEIFVNPAQSAAINELEGLDQAWRDSQCQSPPCGIPCPEPPPATCSGGLCSLPPAP